MQIRENTLNKHVVVGVGEVEGDEEGEEVTVMMLERRVVWI